MKNLYTLITLLLLSNFTYSQTNLLVTNPEADAIIKGNYDAADYLPSNLLNHPDDAIMALLEGVNPDSLKSYLEVLASFGNRNTGSDTISNSFGIGAARRWAFAKFEAFSAQNENRLITSYFQFDQDVCDMSRHKNVLSVLPGIGPQKDQIIIVEAHMDSRCEDDCDVDCQAEGVEDNGSGTALVLELARVMGQLAFNRTVVFMETTGEEQGLVGANAFAEYCEQEDIDVYAVFNND